MKDNLVNLFDQLAARLSTTPYYRVRIRYFGQAALIQVWRTSREGDGSPSSRMVKEYQTTSRAAAWSAKETVRELQAADPQ